MKHVLFLCTGNTCRSPMAAALFDRYAREQGMDASADSAGLAAWPGERVSPHAVTVMAELGADVSAHVARPVTKELLDAADRIFCMSAEQVGALQAAGYPAQLLGEGIPDPYGGTVEDYRRCRDAIAAALPQAAEGL